MLNAAATAVISLLSMIAPGATGGLIAKIIDALVTIIPIVIKEAKDLAPMVQNIIALLRGNTEITPDQLDQHAAEVVLDSAFDIADAAAQKEDEGL